MDSVLSSTLFAFSRLGRLAIFSVATLAVFATVSVIIFVALSGGGPSEWAILTGEKADLFDAGYGPYYSGSTEREAPSTVSALIPRQELGGTPLSENGQQIA